MRAAAGIGQGRPAAAAEDASCAQEILSALARRAYRGHQTAGDLAVLQAFYEQGRRDGGTFEAGIDLARDLELLAAASRPGAPPAIRRRAATAGCSS